jgi:hypothetical protein
MPGISFFHFLGRLTLLGEVFFNYAYIYMIYWIILVLLIDNTDPCHLLGQIKEFHMFRKYKLPLLRARRLGMLIAVSSIVFLAAACGSSVTPSAPVAASGNVPATGAPVAVATQVATPAIPASNYPDACTVLTQDAVSKVLGTTVDTAVSSGLGGVCTYTSKAASLKIDFTIAGHTGGAKAMNTQLARLGDLALVVPGLGDQAFYNTNPDVGSPLFLLKGDAEYLFSMSDVNYQPLDPAMVQATEKALAEQLLSNLE